MVSEPGFSFQGYDLLLLREDWSLLDPAQTGFYGEFIIGEDCGVSLPSKVRLHSAPLLRPGTWGSTYHLTVHPHTLMEAPVHSGVEPLCRLTIAWCYHIAKLSLLPDCFTYTTKYNLYPLHLLFFYHSYSDSFHCWFSDRTERVIPNPQLPFSVSSPALSACFGPSTSPAWPLLVFLVCCVSSNFSPLPVSESPLSSHPGFLWEQRPDEDAYPSPAVNRRCGCSWISPREKENEPRVPELQDFQGKDMSQVSYLGEEWYQNWWKERLLPARGRPVPSSTLWPSCHPLDHVLVEWILPHPSFLMERMWYFNFPRCGSCLFSQELGYNEYLSPPL